MLETARHASDKIRLQGVGSRGDGNCHSLTPIRRSISPIQARRQRIGTSVNAIMTRNASIEGSGTLAANAPTEI
jgi:hypothetical protein